MRITKDIWRSIAVTVVVAIPLFIVATMGLAEIEAQVDDRLDSLANAATTSVEHFLDAQARLQIDLAAEHLSGSLAGSELAWASATARSAFSMVLDEEGHILAIYPERPTLGVGDEIGSQFGHFRAALGGQVGIWSAGNVASVESGAIVALAVPFETSSGLRVFSSAFSLGDGPLIEQLEAIMRPAGQSSSFGIFNADSVLISAQTPQMTVSPELILGRSGTEESLAAVLDSAETVHLDRGDETLITMTRPISGTDWQLLVTADHDELHTSIGASTPVESYGVVAGLLIVIFGMTLLGFVMRSQRNAARELGAEISTAAKETKATIEQTPVAMVVTRNGVVRDCNLAFETLSGWTLEESRGRPFPEMLSPVAADDSDEAAAALSAGRSVTITRDIFDRNGDTKTVRCQVRPILDATMGVVGEIHQLADVTDLRLAEIAAVELAARTEQEVRGAAHDLKSPIVAMIGYAEFLSDDWASLSVDLAREMTGRISSAGQRALEMIDERMALQPDPQPASFATDINATCEWVEEILGGTIRVEFSGSIDRADLDEQSLRTVLLNLATNSVKYAAPGTSPRIAITATRGGDMIEIVASDNGIGISDHLAGKVFEPGFQLDASSPGTGHGLAMVSDLVTNAGGTIRINDQSEAGTTFVIRIPEGQRSTSPITGSNDAMVATVSAINESDIMIGNA